MRHQLFIHDSDEVYGVDLVLAVGKRCGRGARRT
jgi:hypothetical protein